MHGRGVSISMCEGFGVRPHADVREYAADLEILQELEVPRINVASIDSDVNRTFDQFARIAEMAQSCGIQTTIEVGPGPVPNLAAALAARRHVGKPYFRLLIDTMHFFRQSYGTLRRASFDGAPHRLAQASVRPEFQRRNAYADRHLAAEVAAA